MLRSRALISLFVLSLAASAARAGVVTPARTGGSAGPKTVFGTVPGKQWGAITGSVSQVLGFKGGLSLTSLTPVVNALKMDFAEFDKLEPTVQQEKLLAAVEAAQQSAVLKLLQVSGAAHAATPTFGYLKESLTGSQELLAHFAAYLTPAARKELAETRKLAETRIAARLKELGWTLVDDAGAKDDGETVSVSGLASVDRDALDEIGHYLQGNANIGDVRKFDSPLQNELTRRLAVSAVIAKMAKADSLSEKAQPILVLKSSLLLMLKESAPTLGGRQEVIVRALVAEAAIEPMAVSALEQVALAASQDGDAVSLARRIEARLQEVSRDPTLSAKQRELIVEALRRIGSSIQPEVETMNPRSYAQGPEGLRPLLRAGERFAARAKAAASDPQTLFEGLAFAAGVAGFVVWFLIVSGAGVQTLVAGGLVAFAAACVLSISLQPQPLPTGVTLGGAPSAPLPAKVIRGGGGKNFVPGSPGEGALIRYIDGARDSVELTGRDEGYTEGIRQALERARQRGVKIIEPRR